MPFAPVTGILFIAGSMEGLRSARPSCCGYFKLPGERSHEVVVPYLRVEAMWIFFDVLCLGHQFVVLEDV